MSFKKLPKEVFLNIIDNLDHSCYSSCIKIDRDWKSLIEPLLYKNLTIDWDENPTSILNNLVLKRSTIGDNVKHLDLKLEEEIKPITSM